MSKRYYEIYSDESDIERNKKNFFIGGIICTPRRSEILNNQILKLRKIYTFEGEFKWTKIGNNSKYINIYKSLLDIYLEDRHSKFYLIKFNKNKGWKEWSRNEEERFFKCYYNYYLNCINPFHRYCLYPDNKKTKYFWDRLKFSLINYYKRHESYDKKVIYDFFPLDSKKENLIQLVDILIKASQKNHTNNGKKVISEYFLEKEKIGNHDKVIYNVFDFDVERVRKT